MYVGHAAEKGKHSPY